MKTALEDQRDFVSEDVGGAAESELTIATGSVTPTLGIHSIDTEADAASDDLTNIVTTNLPDGRLLLIHANNGARDVVVKHNAGGAGQIALQTAADFTLDTTSKWVLLKRTGADWEEIGRFPNSIGGVPTTQAFGDTATEGSSGSGSRVDHKHGLPTHVAGDHAGFHSGTPTTQAFGDSAAAGSAQAGSRNDHKHGIPAHAQVTHAAFHSGTPTAEAIGSTGSAGSSQLGSRTDHRHAMPGTGTPSTQAFSDSPSTGVGAGVSRSDHKHGMPSHSHATSIGTGELKSSTGSSSQTVSANITMNDYSFFPSITCSVAQDKIFAFEPKFWYLQAHSSTVDPGNTIGRIRVVEEQSPGTIIVRWRYITASRPAELVVVRSLADIPDKSIAIGDIVGVWASEIQDFLNPPIAMDIPHEAIEIVKLPDPMFDRSGSIDAMKVMADIKRGQLQFKGTIRRPTVPGADDIPDNDPLKTEARNRGRIIFSGANLGELGNP